MQCLKKEIKTSTKFCFVSLIQFQLAAIFKCPHFSFYRYFLFI